jgi:hypothetical protein
VVFLSSVEGLAGKVLIAGMMPRTIQVNKRPTLWGEVGLSGRSEGKVVAFLALSFPVSRGARDVDTQPTIGTMWVAGVVIPLLGSSVGFPLAQMTRRVEHAVVAAGLDAGMMRATASVAKGALFEV